MATATEAKSPYVITQDVWGNEVGRRVMLRPAQAEWLRQHGTTVVDERWCPGCDEVYPDNGWAACDTCLDKQAEWESRR